MANTVKKLSEKHKKAISIASLGRVFSTEHKNKLKGKIPWNKGKKGLQKAWNKGIPQIEKTKLKISNTRKGKYSGVNCFNWRGGISKIDKLCRNMSEYKQWRSDCFVRDNWTCRTCGFNTGYVTVHHIKGFSKIIKKNNIKDILDARKCSELWDISNGITLCEECHTLTDNYKGRARKLNI